MKLLRWRVGGLYWRITVSYFLVTLVSALIIEAAFTLGPLIAELQHPRSSMRFDELLQHQQAPHIAPYLEQGISDPTTLQDDVLQPLLDASDNYAENDIRLVAVLDRNGQVLVAGSCDPPKAFSPQRVQARTGPCTAITATQAEALLSPTHTQTAITAVLSGDSQPAEVASPGPDKQTAIAVPILSRDHQILGVLVAVIVGSGDIGSSQSVAYPSFRDFLHVFLNNLQPAGFYFLLLATVIGTLSGLLISGGITRRLRRITQATAAWSRGEFQVAVADRSRDELGQLAHDLNRMAGQLQSLLAARQELAVVEERNRLARELHDSVKQHVFANMLLVRAARKLIARDPDKAQAHLADAEQLADQAQQELIALIRALRPAAIADKGLAATLREYAGDWQRRMGIALEVRVQGERTTPLDSEETLFRVAQEALSNVARHSDAQQVEVLLAWSAEQVYLTIHDDGKGFDAARPAGKGVGLASMRERLEALGGTLSVASSSAGTTIEAALPLSAPALEPVEVIHE